MFRIGSLFSGVGALDLGVEFAIGGETVWLAEKDPGARRILRRHWEDAIIFEDAADVDEHAPRVDMIVGGFPCQDVSNLGSKKGLDGEKSGQWSLFKRAIEKVKPDYVFIENVSALLGRGALVVLRDLADHGMHAVWDRVPATIAGAPHERARTFILAYSDPERLSDLATRRLRTRSIESLREDANRRYAAIPRATDGPRDPDTRPGSGLVPGVRREAYGTRTRLDRDRRERLGWIGNAANVDQVEIAFLLLASRIGSIP